MILIRNNHLEDKDKDDFKDSINLIVNYGAYMELLKSLLFGFRFNQRRKLIKVFELCDEDVCDADFDLTPEHQ